VGSRTRTSRFKSQALLDEQALAACMAYVDLNPVRAKMAETPETSAHTSAQLRITEVRTTQENTNRPCQPISLLPFVGNPRNNMPQGLPFKLEDYLELLDWTGQCIREDKRGAISNDLPPILDRLNFDTKNWLYTTQNFESSFKGMVGTINKVRAAYLDLGYQRVPKSGFIPITV